MVNRKSSIHPKKESEKKSKKSKIIENIVKLEENYIKQNITV